MNNAKHLTWFSFLTLSNRGPTRTEEISSLSSSIPVITISIDSITLLGWFGL